MERNVKRKSSMTQKLFEELRGRIFRGEIPVGAELPSARELALQAGISINTAQRTLAKLEAQDLIECGPGRLSVVKARTSRVIRSATLRGSRVAYIRSLDSTLASQPYASLGPWHAAVFSGFEKVMGQEGLQLVSIPLPPGSNIEGVINEQLDHLGKELVGGMSFASDLPSSLVGKILRDRGLASVTINRPFPDASHNFVSADYLGAGRRVGWCFAKMGFRRLLLLGANFNESVSWQELSAGLIQNYLAEGLPVDGLSFVSADVGFPVEVPVEVRGYELTKAHLANCQVPQGIFAAGDHLALGAIRACREAGLSVPHDVGVIGGTGYEMAQFTDPPLSVVAQPMERVGHEAASMLLEMLQNGVTRMAGRIVSTPLVLRGSTVLSDELKAQLKQGELEQADL